MNFEKYTVLTFAILISLSGILINIWKKPKTPEPIHHKTDSSLILFRFAYPLMIIISLALYFAGFSNICSFPLLSILAYLMIFLGILIRWISIIQLGNSFTVKVMVQKNQALRTTGIYKHIRHPSYTGLLLYYTGLGVAMHNIICILILTIVPAFVIFYRIKYEEKVLAQYFKDEYSRYQKTSWKLIPYII